MTALGVDTGRQTLDAACHEITRQERTRDVRRRPVRGDGHDCLQARSRACSAFLKMQQRRSNGMPTETDRLARRALFAFTLTFIGARAVVFLIMSQRMPNLYFFLRGTHVHHLNYGIFLLAGVGAYLLLWRPAGEAASVAAVFYGMAMALTFDEFGMWLHLGGSYWQRASVDAVIVVAALLSLVAFARSLRSFESRHLKASIAILIALIAFGVVLYDTSIQVGRLEGPRLRELELSSSP